jgi:hypothetical protein
MITDVLDEQIHQLQLSEKKSTKVARVEDSDSENEEDHTHLSPETRGAIHEKRVCELAARMTLGVIASSLPKTIGQTLLQHKGKLGQSYDKVVLELGIIPESNVGKPVLETVEVGSVMDES